jgi:transposase-like protein
VPRRYPVEFRRKVLDLVEAGKPVAEIADQLGVTTQTVYNWRNQDLVDQGLRAGTSTSESAELTAARKRIRELETELAVTKRTNELLKAQSDLKAVGGRRSDRERGPPGRGDLSGGRGVGVRFLQLATSQAVGSGGAACDGRRCDPSDPRRVPSDLRCTQGPRRTGAGSQHDVRFAVRKSFRPGVANSQHVMVSG